MGKDLELTLCESKCVSLTPRPLLSPLVFSASGDTANTVTQTQGKEAKKTHAPDVTSGVRTVPLCAAGQDHRHADLPEPGPGQPLQPLLQARSPGVQNHVDSTHFFHCPVPPLGNPSPSQNQALRMLPGDPTPRQNISPWYPSPEHSARALIRDTVPMSSRAILNSNKLTLGYNLQNATNREGIYSQFKANY